MNIGIVGFGFVGQVVYFAIKDKQDVCVYDLNKKLDTKESILKTDYLFICINSPTINGVQDDTGFKELFGYLRENNYTGIIIVKSTLLYNSYPKGLNIVYSPEFLKQNDAIKDYENQHVIVIGGDAHLASSVKWLYENKFNLPELEEIVITTLKEAVDLKYVHNIYHAYKSLFWNYVYELGMNHRKMADLYMKISERRNEMSNICADGSLGFGGACFPKDLVAFDNRHKHVLTNMMINYNQMLRPVEMGTVL